MCEPVSGWSAADRSHGLNSPATTRPDTMPATNMLL